MLSLDQRQPGGEEGPPRRGRGAAAGEGGEPGPLERIPVLKLTAIALSQQQFAPEEGFVLSRINGQWDVRSILKLCPMPEDETLLIFARLLDRQVIDLR